MPEADVSEGTSWALVKGGGRAYQGRCRLVGIIFWPDVAADYVDIYDGLDVDSGKKFCRVETDTDETVLVNFTHPVEFSSGIYVDGIDSAVQTTVIFEPLEL